MAEMTVLVCVNAQAAEEARQYLKGKQVTNITIEEIATFVYDAETYKAGGTHDNLSSKIVVIGRQ
jgi:hypothetical protein